MNLRLEYLPREELVLRTLAWWIHEEWAHLNPGRTLGQVHRRLKRRAGSRRVPLTILARVDGLAVGTASLILSDMDGLRDATPWLGAVYVIPNFRGRGIGGRLCRRIEAEGRRLRLERLYLFTEDREDFYERMGWETEERLEYRERRVVIMGKDL